MAERHCDGGVNLQPSCSLAVEEGKGSPFRPRHESWEQSFEYDKTSNSLWTRRHKSSRNVFPRRHHDFRLPITGQGIDSVPWNASKYFTSDKLDGV